MSVPVIHESEVEELDLPGRRFRWLVAEDRIQSKYSSVCVIRVAPGDKVRPAHSHPQGEEVIYIISGSGRVLVEGEVAQPNPTETFNPLKVSRYFKGERQVKTLAVCDPHGLSMEWKG